MRLSDFGVSVSAAVGVLLVAGCESGSHDDSASELRVSAAVSSTADSVVVTLSQSATALAVAMPLGLTAPSVIERMMLPDSAQHAHIADVAALSGGRFAVLLRDLKEVVVVADGVAEQRFGRGGQGPGEFRDPIALQAHTEGFAVMDADALHVFSSSGTPRDAVRMPWLPDWGWSFNRQPLLWHQAPYQMGPEDLSRRISRGPRGFFVLAGERGLSLTLPPGGTSQLLSLTLLAVSASGGRADSVAAVQGPVRKSSSVAITDKSGKPLRDVSPLLSEPLFSDRPLIAGTEHWLAVFDPAQNQVRVTFANGSKEVVVRWPADKVAISDSMRAHVVDWMNVDMVMAAADESLAKEWRSRANRQSFDFKVRQSHAVPISETLASVAALFADSQCLWLVGTDPRDFTDGTSHWGIAVNIETNAVHGPVRLAQRGRQLRDVGHGYAYSTGRKWSGEHIVERTPLPGCAE